MTKNKINRQGDITLIPIKDIPNNYVPIKGRTIALGEATGHHHSFHNELGDITLYGNPEENNLSVNERGIVVDVNGIPIKNIINFLKENDYKETTSEFLNNKFKEKGLKDRHFVKSIKSIFYCEETLMFVVIPECESGSILAHDEHRMRIIPSGKYIRKIQYEYSPSGILSSYRLK